MKFLIFVYGTLREGGRLHGRLAGQEKRFDRATLADHGMYPAGRGSFPGIVPREGSQVVGEVYMVTEPCLHSLDYLEGHPSHYRREIVRVECYDGNSPWSVHAYIHQIPPDAPEWIETGDWLEYINRDEEE
jgi:gamma-glutamylaminecyclotransferase